MTERDLSLCFKIVVMLFVIWQIIRALRLKYCTIEWKPYYYTRPSKEESERDKKHYLSLQSKFYFILKITENMVRFSCKIGLLFLLLAGVYRGFVSLGML